MRRITLDRMREDWQSKVEGLGFYFHEMDGLPYWDESLFYEFTSDQIDYLEEVTQELYRMCKRLVEHVFDNGLAARMAIPDAFFQFAKESWLKGEPSIYGRFDLWWDGGGRTPSSWNSMPIPPRRFSRRAWSSTTGSRTCSPKRTSSTPSMRSSWTFWAGR
jgi:glutathionylspermidine synthase